MFSPFFSSHEEIHFNTKRRRRIGNTQKLTFSAISKIMFAHNRQLFMKCLITEPQEEDTVEDYREHINKYYNFLLEMSGKTEFGKCGGE